MRAAVDERGWSVPQFAEGCGIGVETVRDFIAGRRWPRAAKRAAMEETLGWDPGTIAKIAREQDQSGDDPVLVAIDQSELSPEARYQMLSLYLSLLRQDRRARDSA